MAQFPFRLGRACARHHWSVIGALVGVVVVVVVIAWQFGGGATNRFDVPGTESSEAITLLEERFPSQSGTSATIVLASEGAPLSGTEDTVERAIEQLGGIDGVSSVIDPLSPPPGVTALSDDETVGLVTVQFSDPVQDVGQEGFEEIDSG